MYNVITLAVFWVLSPQGTVMRNFGFLAAVIAAPLFIATLLTFQTAGAGEEIYDAFRPGSVLNQISDLERCRIAVIKGSEHAEALEGQVKVYELVPCESTAEQVAALKEKRVEAAIIDLPVARMLAAADKGLKVMPELLEAYDYALGFRYYSEELRKEADALIAKIKEDGVLEEMTARWIDGKPEDRVMPAIRERPLGESLKMGVAAIVEPFAYLDKDGKPTGFDIELGKRITENSKMRLLVVQLPFEELIPSLRSGVVDMIGSALAVTPAREKLITFSEPYFHSGAAVLIRAE